MQQDSDDFDPMPCSLSDVSFKLMDVDILAVISFTIAEVTQKVNFPEISDDFGHSSIHRVILNQTILKKSLELYIIGYQGIDVINWRCNNSSKVQYMGVTHII